MPYHLQTNCCRTNQYVDCICDPAAVLAEGAHRGDCVMSDLDGSLVCTGASPGCCTEEHDHAAAAECPGGHGECALDVCAVLTPAGEPCPGGHCGKGIPGCNVCRPITITAMPGSATLTHFAGSGPPKGHFAGPNQRSHA